MRHYKKLIPLLGLCISISIFAKPVLNIQHWTTNNGAKVLFVATKALPIVDVEISFMAGSAQDGNQFGVAQFTNAMLDQGTDKLDADQIAAAFDKVGALFDVNVGRDIASLHLRSITKPDMLEPALATFVDLLSEPVFTRRAFYRTQQQTLGAIQQTQQEPSSMAVDAFYKLLYGNLPYAHPIIGTKNSVKKLTRKDLQTFYDKYYVAENASIAIVGDITLEQAKAIANQLTARLPSGDPVTMLQTQPKVNGAAQRQINFEAQQSTILLGQTGITYKEANYFPLLVGNFILGQSPLTSLLFQEVRNKRALAYDVASSFNLLKNTGPFIIFLQTRNDQCPQAIGIAVKTLKDFITKGPTQAQLDAAKNSMIGNFPLGIANNDQILAMLTTIGFYDLPLNYLDTYRDNINKVTIAEVKAAFKHQIDPDKLLSVIVGGCQ